jgi:curved DNA-binding protein CbpA
MKTSNNDPWPKPPAWFSAALVLAQKTFFLLLLLFESLVAPDQRKNTRFHYRRNHAGGSRGNYSFSHRDNDTKAELLEAYKFLCLERGQCTEDDVAKQWRKLSMKHHPDRNNQSQESVEMTQKLNHLRDLILREDFSGSEHHESAASDDDEGADDAHHHDEPHRPQHYYANEEEEDGIPRRHRPNQQGQQPWKKSKKKQKRNNNRKKNKSKSRERRHQSGFFYGNDDENDYYHHYSNEVEEEEDNELRECLQTFLADVEKVKQEQESLKVGLRALHSNRSRDKQKDRKKKDLFRKHKGIDTSTSRGRDKAHDIWMEQTKRTAKKEAVHVRAEPVPQATRVEPSESSSSATMVDIDDHENNDDNMDSMETNTEKEPTNNSKDDTTKSETPVEKPINYTMEQCCRAIVVAMRLGLHDSAVKMLAMSCVPRDDEDDDMGEHESEVLKEIQKMLESSLDDDDNTMFHYAVYYESDTMISALLAMYSDTLEKIGDLALFYPRQPLGMMLKENMRGQIPQDFLRCSPSSYFDQRIRNLTDMAQKEKEGSTLQKRATKLLQRMDIFAILYSFGMYHVYCRYFFGCGRIISFLACMIQSNVTVEEPRERIVYSIMVLWIYRALFSPVWGYIRYFFWTTWTSFFVSALVVWGLQKLRIIKSIVLVGGLAATFAVELVCVKLIGRLSDQLDKKILFKFTSSNKWLASNPNVNGLFYLVVYGFLLFMSQSLGSSIWFLVFGASSNDDLMSTAAEGQAEEVIMEAPVRMPKRIPSLQELESTEL